MTAVNTQRPAEDAATKLERLKKRIQNLQTLQDAVLSNSAPSMTSTSDTPSLPSTNNMASAPHNLHNARTPTDSPSTNSMSTMPEHHQQIAENATPVSDLSTCDVTPTKTLRGSTTLECPVGSTLFGADVDCQLIFGTGNDCEVFMVSSSALKNSSRIWMGLIQESATGSSSGPGLQTLRVPNLLRSTSALHDTLSILMNIIHLQFDLLPTELNFNQLEDLMLVSKEYEHRMLIRPFVKEWVGRLPDTELNTRSVFWLRMSWELLDYQTFCTLANRLLYTCRSSKLGNALFTPEGERLSEDQLPELYRESFNARAYTIMLIISSGWIEQKRQGLFEDVLSKLKKWVEARENREGSCKLSGNTDELACNALRLGGLIRNLTLHGLWPLPTTTLHLPLSVGNFVENLESFHILDLPGHNGICDLDDKERRSALLEKCISLGPGVVSNSMEDDGLLKHFAVLARPLDGLSKYETSIGFRQKDSKNVDRNVHLNRLQASSVSSDGATANVSKGTDDEMAMDIDGPSGPGADADVLDVDADSDSDSDYSPPDDDGLSVVSEDCEEYPLPDFHDEESSDESEDGEDDDGLEISDDEE
ncbi:hypothetical protein K402DRAFT_393875 [Aulographum hederae CBS 113979]|uniref:Uncharacterized protein n=1 Tax=Aulographum hederae CBS 113979 TaxID=1176131 RepID=A0A6G1H028_9PEZI|nr:hypothetical protein K402DRAFT_393875 [Aulographum hederae CBS 113979]